MANPDNRASTSTASKGDDDLASPQPEKATAELSAVIDELLDQLSDKFSSVSGDLLSRMDDMSQRLDSLEAAILANNNGDNEK